VQLENKVKDVLEFYNPIEVEQNDCKDKGRENPPTDSLNPLQHVSEEIEEGSMRL
jgi:hypothetical protein